MTPDEASFDTETLLVTLGKAAIADTQSTGSMDSAGKEIAQETHKAFLEGIKSGNRDSNC